MTEHNTKNRYCQVKFEFIQNANLRISQSHTTKTGLRTGLFLFGDYQNWRASRELFSTTASSKGFKASGERQTG